MSTARAEARVVTSRIVLFGPAGAGTTTTLETIARRLRADQRGALVRQGSPDGRGGAYELLPVELGEVKGLSPRFQLVTVPGGPAHVQGRRQLLKGVDGVLFVADSAPDQVADAAAAMRELAEHLAAYGRPLETLPVVIVLNKRDRPEAVPAEQMLRPLLQRLKGRRPPVFETVATDGRGVVNALSAIAKLVLARLNHHEAPASRPSAPGAPEPAGPGGGPGAALLTPSADEAARTGPPGSDHLAEHRAVGHAAGGVRAGEGRPAGLEVTARPASAGADVTIGAPHATADGLIVPLLVRSAGGAETRLTLTFRIEPSRGDAPGHGGRGGGS